MNYLHRGFSIRVFGLHVLGLMLCAAPVAAQPEPAAVAPAEGVWDFASLGDVELSLELLAEDEAPELQAHLTAAEDHLRRGRATAALEALRELPTTGAHQPLAQRLAAWAYFQKKDYKSLGDTLTRIKDDQIDLHFLAAVAHLHLSEGKNVLPLRRLWWRGGPTPWGLAALRYLAQNTRLYDSKQRVAILRTLPEVRVLQGVVGEHLALLERVRRKSSPRSNLRAEVILAMGRESMRRDPRRSTDLLGEAMALARDPQLSRAIALALGEVYRIRGNLTLALKHFDEVAHTEADDLAQAAIAEAAQMLVAHGQYDDARQRFALQLQHGPSGRERQWALWGLGWVAFRMGAYPDARALFHTVLAEEPFGPLADRALYWGARAASEQGEHEQARGEWVHLLERFPISYYAYQAVKQLGPAPWPAPVAVHFPEAPHPEVKQIADWVNAGLDDAAHDALQDMVERAPEFLGPADLERLADLCTAVGDRRLAFRYRYRRHRYYPVESPAGLAPLRSQFPDYYVERVRREAKRQGLDGDLVAALVRQESGYNAQAVSPTGALGLMQLMPPTAAELLGTTSVEAQTVLAVSTNIRLGTRYLRRMLKSFGQEELALAAYNAGPGSVGRWLRERGKLPMDIFVEEIPYHETQQYVRKIMGWYRALRMVRGVLPVQPRPVIAAR